MHTSRMPLPRCLSEHPESVGETYGEHLAAAWGFGGRMIVAGIACWVHGLFPFLFTTTASAMVRSLHDRLVLHRRNPSRVTSQPAASAR